MSRFAHSAHPVRSGVAALTTATAVLAACAVQWTPAAAATRAPAGGSAPAAAATLSAGWTEPWGISFLPDGKRALVTERHSATVWLQGRDGSKKKVGAVPNTVNGTASAGVGNGGLMGVAPSPTWNGTTDRDVFFVHTAAEGTRVVKMRFDGTSLSGYTVILGGIRRGGDHNGGRIVFGPDGYLYVTTGDARRGALAQDRNSLNGKILRITRTGAAAPGNPFGNRVYSLGHRNPQGLAWDTRGRLWESEIGADTWDELNLIRPGANYGWPACEGGCSAAGMTNPKAVWKPSGGGVPAQLAVVDNAVYASTLRGERLWRLPINADGRSVGKLTAYYSGAYGKLRALAKVPGANELWLGTDRNGYRLDKILRVTVR
ncbi:PQQ-dependent sugar dehydrogenase [Streptomyces sp. NPDC048710]|uniref:PQQ-dependent sugar dehydrogenase n=1 Tax=Streptomyces sp. NPDC048710 TaxID=3365586 RepID=UPI0037100303